MMLRATKVRIYPTPEQAEFLHAQFGAVRFAYNKALHLKKHAYRQRVVVKRVYSLQVYTNGLPMPVLIFNTNSLVQSLTKAKR